MGLVVHVVNNSASTRSMRLSATDREDLVAEVFFAIIDNDYAVLRHFRGQSSLATYLTVVARRVVVRALLAASRAPTPSNPTLSEIAQASRGLVAEQRIADRDEVARLLTSLDAAEAKVVRMYHLEGMSYDEISRQTGMAAGSVGPLLSRARSKMRLKADPTVG